MWFQKPKRANRRRPSEMSAAVEKGDEASRRSILLLTPLKKKEENSSLLQLHVYTSSCVTTTTATTTNPPSRFFPISPPYFCFTLPVLCIAPSSFLHISILSPPLLQGLILLELHTTLHSTLTSYYIEDPAERRNTAATIRGLAE